jgi:hypothetical protein
VKIGRLPSLCPPLNIPTFNLPQRSFAANTLIAFPAQLPAMEFMAPDPFPLEQQQTVRAGLKLAVSHLQSASSGIKRQQTRHRMKVTIGIRQPLTQQQHSAAFGVDRLVLNPFVQG